MQFLARLILFFILIGLAVYVVGIGGIVIIILLAILVAFAKLK